MWFVWIMAAQAADFRVERYRESGTSRRAVADLRLGVDGLGQGDERVMPYVCGEVMPLPRLSLEGCGNGSGIWHQVDGPDLAHFRVRATLSRRQQGVVEQSVVAGIGVMEVQRTVDRPGFRFGQASTEAVEAAGPEASLGLKGRYWVMTGGYVTADIVGGVAHVPGAPAVMGWSGPVVPFASVSVGLGL